MVQHETALDSTAGRESPLQMLQVLYDKQGLMNLTAQGSPKVESSFAALQRVPLDSPNYRTALLKAVDAAATDPKAPHIWLFSYPRLFAVAPSVKNIPNDYVVQRKPRRVVLITECSMADNVAADAPDTEFVRPCNLCPHMKRITLENIYESLLHERHEVTVDPAIAERARLAVQRMVDLPPPARPARYDLVKARHHVDVELI